MYRPSREHGPAHVHIEHADAEMVVMLMDCSVSEDWGMRAADIATAVALVEEWQGYLLDVWTVYHGEVEGR